MASITMYRVGDLLPRRDLFFTPNSWCVRPFRPDHPTPSTLDRNPWQGMGSAHLPLARYKGPFGDDEPSTAGSALVVVLLQHIGRNGSDGAVAGKRGHEDPVVNRDGAEFEWVEEACDGCHLVC